MPEPTAYSTVHEPRARHEPGYCEKHNIKHSWEPGPTLTSNPRWATRKCANCGKTQRLVRNVNDGGVLDLEYLNARLRRDIQDADMRVAELKAVIGRAGALASQKAPHDLIRETLAEVSMWRSVKDEPPPLSQSVLFWWRPIADPKYPHPPDAASWLSNNRHAECCVIGQLSEHEPGMWWNGQTAKYQDIWHITHWMPLPKSPMENC